MVRRRFRGSLSIVALASLALRWFIPPNPLWSMPHDDLLMVRLADQIRAGHWLGEYDTLGNLTLAKPAGYPLFLARTHFLPWPPTVTVHLLVLAGLALICRDLRRHSAPRALVLAVFTAGAFFPPFFDDQMSRIYRESLLTALTLVSLGLAMHLGALLTDHRPLRGRSFTSLVNICGSSFALGLCLSLYMATKPSWHAAALVSLVLLVRPFLDIRLSEVRQRLATIGVVAATLLVGLASIVGYVVVQNNRHFGVAHLDTFATGPYADALSAWTSVASGNPRPYVLVDKGQREAVYEVSATARSLRPYLEGPPNTGWRRISCESLMKVCDESGAWFPWELRDAVALAGFDSSAEEFQATMARLAKEIGVACDGGALHCSLRGIGPLSLPPSKISPRVFVDAMALGAVALVDVDAYSSRIPPGSIDIDVQQTWYRNVKGLPSASEQNTYRQSFLDGSHFVTLLEVLYKALWPPLALIALLGHMINGRNGRRWDLERLFGAAAVAGIAVSVGQLAVLEASAGPYMTDGRHLYLLPTHGYMIFFIATGATRFWKIRSSNGAVA